MAHKKNGEPYKTYAADPRTTEELIRQAIEEWDLDYEDRPDLPALTVLHSRGDALTFEAARTLASSGLGIERAVAARILGEFGLPHRTMPAECVQALLEMLSVEADPEVLASICGVFNYHEKTVEIARAVSRFKNHPDENVRFGVVIGLLWSPHDEAIATLIELTRNTDEDVRNWATFGIGKIIDGAEEPERWDTPAIRQALFDRLDDPHWETKFEALSGLALRRDVRIVDRMVKMLAEDDPMSPQELCEALKEMIEHYSGSKEQLELALSRCEDDTK